MSSFPPDSPLVDRVLPSPNHEARIGVARPDILLLHYTGMKSTQAALERLCDPGPRVSSHYLVFEDGRILQLVPEARRAYHAGAGSWEGASDVNSRSIGIEIGNQGHDFGCPEFPDVQIAAVIALCRDILARSSIAAARVLAHSDTAPDRKRDPGEAFPWRRLAEAGVGLPVGAEPIADGGPRRAGACGAGGGDARADRERRRAAVGRSRRGGREFAAGAGRLRLRGCDQRQLRRDHGA